MNGEVRPILLEQLEPRILLSGEGLLNIGPNPHQETILNNTHQVAQYAELLETNNEEVVEQLPVIEQLVDQEPEPSDTFENNLYEPIVTLFINQDNTDTDGPVDVLSNSAEDTESKNTLTEVIDTNFDAEVTNISAISTEDRSMPILNDADISIEYATSIEIRGPPATETVALSGMHLVDPTADYFEGQIIYLDFDGAQNITYNGPVTVEGIDVPLFTAPGELAGQEKPIIADVVARVEEVFVGSGVVFTTEKPAPGQIYSTIFIGGNDSDFAEYGSFFGLAEQVDAGNQNPCDNAFVFSESIVSGQTDLASLIAVLVDLIVHETGHLLGYAHVDIERDASGPLHAVALEVKILGPSGTILAPDTEYGFGVWIQNPDDAYTPNLALSVSGGTVMSYSAGTFDGIGFDDIENQYTWHSSVLEKGLIGYARIRTDAAGELALNLTGSATNWFITDYEYDQKTYTIANLTGEPWDALSNLAESRAKTNENFASLYKALCIAEEPTVGVDELFSGIPESQKNAIQAVQLLGDLLTGIIEPSTAIASILIQVEQEWIGIPSFLGGIELWIKKVGTISDRKTWYHTWTSGPMSPPPLAKVSLTDAEGTLNLLNKAQMNEAAAWAAWQDGKADAARNALSYLEEQEGFIDGAIEVAKRCKDNAAVGGPMFGGAGDAEGEAFFEGLIVHLEGERNVIVAQLKIFARGLISYFVTPQTPAGSTPADEVNTLTPLFQWSSFLHGGDEDTQAGYQLRVRCDTDGDVVVYDTGFIPDTSSHSHTYSPGTYTGYDAEAGITRVSEPLEPGKYYHWHVRYRDDSGNWSHWSNDTPETHLDFYVNIAPVIAGLPDRNLYEDSSLDDTIDLWLCAWDGETPDNGLTFSIVSNTNPDCGVSIDGNRYIDISPAADWNGTSDVTIQVSDGYLTDTDEFLITVNPVNDAPAANHDFVTIDEDTVVTIDVLANDSDIDGDTLTVTSVGDPSNGLVVVNSDNTVTYMPDANYHGIDSFIYEVSDGNGGTDTATVTVTVNLVYYPPVLEPIGDKSINENNLLTFTVNATDADVDTIVYSAQSLPSGAIFSSQTFTWTPSYDQAGMYQVTFTADDGHVQDYETITITVVNVNRAPILTVDALLTNDSTPELTGTVDDPDAAIEVTVGGKTYSAINNGDGTWTLADDTISPALLDDVYDVSVKATDLAGNIGTDSTLDELTIDTTAPTDIFFDDFENIAIGDYPDENGWKVLFSGKSAYVSDAVAHTGTKSFRLESYSTWSRTDYISLPELPDRLTYEVSVYPDPTPPIRAMWIGFPEAFGNQGPFYNRFNIHVSDGSAGTVMFTKGVPGSQYIDVGEFTVGDWVTIRADLDFTSLTANLWLNGELAVTNVAITPKEFEHTGFGHVTLSKFGATEYNWSGSGTGVIYIDDVKLYETPVEARIVYAQSVLHEIGDWANVGDLLGPPDGQYAYTANSLEQPWAGASSSAGSAVWLDFGRIVHSGTIVIYHDDPGGHYTDLVVGPWYGFCPGVPWPVPLASDVATLQGNIQGSGTVTCYTTPLDFRYLRLDHFTLDSPLQDGIDAVAVIEGAPSGVGIDLVPSPAIEGPPVYAAGQSNNGYWNNPAAILGNPDGVYAWSSNPGHTMPHLVVDLGHVVYSGTIVIHQGKTHLLKTSLGVSINSQEYDSDPDTCPAWPGTDGWEPLWTGHAEGVSTLQFPPTYFRYIQFGQSQCSGGQEDGIDAVEVYESPERPILVVSENALDFGVSSYAMQFNISNAGSGMLTWSITSDEDWIVFKPVRGITTTEADSVSVMVNRNMLPLGHHEGSLSIQSNVGTESVTVSVTVGNGSISGKVTEADETTPIPNALVIVQGHNVLRLWTLTESDGSYCVEGLKTGLYNVTILKSEYITQTQVGIQVLADVETSGINFVLKAICEDLAGLLMMNDAIYAEFDYLVDLHRDMVAQITADCIVDAGLALARYLGSNEDFMKYLAEKTGKTTEDELEELFEYIDGKIEAVDGYNIAKDLLEDLLGDLITEIYEIDTIKAELASTHDEIRNYILANPNPSEYNHQVIAGIVHQLNGYIEALQKAQAYDIGEIPFAQLPSVYLSTKKRGEEMPEVNRTLKAVSGYRFLDQSLMASFFEAILSVWGAGKGNLIIDLGAKPFIVGYAHVSMPQGLEVTRDAYKFLSCYIGSSEGFKPYAYNEIGECYAIVNYSLFSSERVYTAAQTITVSSDQNANFAGMEIEIPADTFSTDSIILMSEVIGGPPLPEEITPVGAVVEIISTHDLETGASVTLKLPYSQSQLDEAGITDASILKIYTYNELSSTWEALVGSVVDAVNKLVVAGVGHFSLYRLGGIRANVAPISNNVVYTMDEDTVLDIPVSGVLANDIDDNGDPLTAILVSGPSDGVLAFNSDGSFTYVPTADFHGVDIFTYKSNDGEFDSNVSTVTINVDPVNDAPVTNDDTGITDEDTLVIIDVLANDSDVDGDALIVANIDAVDTTGLVIDNGDGTVSYSPNGQFEWLGLGQSATDTFCYIVSDGNGGTDSATVSVTITGVNDIPLLDAGSDQLVNEGQTVNLMATFTDPDSTDTHTATINWGDGMVEPGIVDELTGEVSGSHVYADNGTYMVKVTVTDDDSGVGSDILTVTVNNVAPTIALSGLGTVEEGSTYILTLGLVNDPGEDTVAEYIVHWSDGGMDTYSSGGDVTHLYADGPANHTIVVDLVDEDGTHPGAATLDVQVTNVAPSLAGATFEVEENSPNSTVVGTASGADLGDDTLIYSIVGGTGASAFAIDGSSGQITVSDTTQLDYETTPSLALEVQVVDDDNATDTATVTIDLLNQASITGTVFVDVNENGVYEANEPGIDGITIELIDENGIQILDAQNNPVIATTSDGGFYLFEDLNPGTYLVHEIQPTGVDDGEEILGSIGGTIPANDTIRLTLGRIDATDYVFAELGQSVTSGDTATIGFWQNKHGQSLIRQGGPALADWLTNNFGNIFGDTFVGGDGNDVASFYRDQLFRQKSEKSAGPAKVDAQFMAVALAAYFTSSNLAGNVAADYGFNVTDTGIGTKVVNVGSNGAAFSVANGSDLTIMQLLLATNDLTDQPDNLNGFARIYDRNGDGEIDEAEAFLRRVANNVFSVINEQGDI